MKCRNKTGTQLAYTNETTVVILVHTLYIQWNLSKTDTIGTEPCVHYMEGVLYSEVFGLSPSADVYICS